MNDDTAKQLVKQLKRLNFWVTTFGVIFLLGLGLIGWLLTSVVMFVRSTSEKIGGFQSSAVQTLDMKQRVCEGSGSFSDFIKTKTSACQ